VPDVMPDPATDPKGENKLAYDNSMPQSNLAALVPRGMPGNTTAAVPAIDPAAAQPPPGADGGDRFVKNTTEPEEVEGSSGGGGGSSGGIGSEGDAMAFLNSLMGPSPNRGPAAEEEIWMPSPEEKKENPGTNLFQYASYRYRVLYKKKTVVAAAYKPKKN